MSSHRFEVVTTKQTSSTTTTTTLKLQLAGYSKQQGGMSDRVAIDLLLDELNDIRSTVGRGPAQAERDVLVILLPILIILSSLLFLLVVFLVFTIILRRRRGIALGDSDGPVDLSRDEFADGAGGFTGVESRWLENVDEETARSYQRAKGT